MSRISLKRVPPHVVTDKVVPVRDDSIKNQIWPAIKRQQNNNIGNYGTGGREKASTRVDWKGQCDHFETRDQMHSEMRALGDMLGHNTWQLTNDGQVKGAEGEEITTWNYSTDLAHCRFCTVMLYLLGLPIKEGYATSQNYKKANELNYPLPEQVRESPVVLGRLLAGHTPPDHREECLMAVKKQLNKLLLRPPAKEWVLEVGDEYVSEDGVGDDPGGEVTKIEWSKISNHKIVVGDNDYGYLKVGRFLWKIGFDGLYGAPL